MVNFGNDWDEIMKGEFDKEYYLKLREFLKYEYTHYEIYPDMYHIFNAMQSTAYNDVKAVIFGQDPYHEPGQAHGLCFSVKRGNPLPPSLRNIYQELYNDLGIPPSQCGELTSWAKNGVLLLNTVLTVRRGQANSHKNMGWEIFTNEVTKKLNKREKPIVFILWGSHAKAKREFITSPQHYILQAGHPSPLSVRYFSNCRHFSKCNDFLVSHGIEPIDWRIE